MSNHYAIYVAGEFRTTDTPLPVISPYSGETVYQTWLAGTGEYATAVSAAQAVRQQMQDLPAYERYRILMQIAEGLLDRRHEFATVLAREAGKPIRTGIGEVDRAAQTFLVAAEESKRLPGEVLSLDWHPSSAGKQGIVKYFPVGLVAGISPFNFPLNLVAHKLAPAIAAGCPMVLKPASKTPISALLLAELIDQTGLPAGALSVLPMDRQTGNQLVLDERFALLSFTGSPDVGWEMKKNCGKKKVVLELGGNAGLIIDQATDLDQVIDRAVYGGFAYSGQSCIHTQRIWVHDTLYDEFIERYRTATEALVIGDPENETTDVASLIDENNARRIAAWVDEALDGGASLICGGQRDGSIYTPTVLSNTRMDMKVCCQEAFAPVVVVERFSDFSEAMDNINNSDFGLQAGIYTRDQAKVQQAFERLHVGGVVINDVPTFRADHQPYGGVKDSGLGREGPKYAIHDMLEPRILILSQ